MHKRGWINSCHVVKNRGGKENGAAPSDECHPRSRGDTRVELSPETTWSRPPRRRGRHGHGAPATCAPRGPAPSAGFGSSAPAGRDGRSRGQTSWFAEPRRSAAEGGEGASDSRKPEQEEEAGGIALSRASTPLRGGACAGPSPPRGGHAAPLTGSP